MFRFRVVLFLQKKAFTEFKQNLRIFLVLTTKADLLKVF